MKHLLNSLTENEKNSIREQHTGGMKVMTENFSKLINTKSGNVRTLVEQPVEEPTPNSTTNPLNRLTGSGTWIVKDGNIQFSDSTGTVVLEIASNYGLDNIEDDDQTSEYKSYDKPSKYDPQYSQDPRERYDHGGSQPGH